MTVMHQRRLPIDDPWVVECRRRVERNAARFGLTDRQREVVTALFTNYAYDDIARHLYMGTSTLKNHLNGIAGRLGIVPARSDGKLFNVRHHIVMKMLDLDEFDVNGGSRADG